MATGHASMRGAGLWQAAQPGRSAPCRPSPARRTCSTSSRVTRPAVARSGDQWPDRRCAREPADGRPAWSVLHSVPAAVDVPVAAEMVGAATAVVADTAAGCAAGGGAVGVGIGWAVGCSYVRSGLSSEPPGPVPAPYGPAGRRPGVSVGSARRLRLRLAPAAAGSAAAPVRPRSPRSRCCSGPSRLPGPGSRSACPRNGDGTSAFTLSVMTSTIGSYLSTWSPGFFSHLPIVPSATLSPSWGICTLGMAG